MKFDKQYWEQRYANSQTGWDAGSITTPIKEFIDSLYDKEQKILVPGAGNGHEFEYLIRQGFTNSYVLDIVKAPLLNITERLPQLRDEQVIHNNFFNLDESFDLVIEQTFFCALNPELRNEYARKMNDIINPGGRLAGLLFEFPLTSEGPPFGGSREEYIETFTLYFNIKKLEPAYNSIKPRAGKELFFIFEKK